MSMSITIYPPSISIHAPRTGSDDERGGIAGEVDFNPRSPHGERHTFRCWLLRLGIFQSTLPARGATRAAQHQQKCNLISIHAPRTGSDCSGKSAHLPCCDFNPRSPHGERRTRFICSLPTQTISIHAPRTGSDPRDATHLHQHHISIHAPRTGSDSPDESRERNRPISIHAPRTGSDGTRRSSCGSRSNFNPRSPHGERRGTLAFIIGAAIFQSTLPARGATRWHFAAFCGTMNFNPRSPHGERLLAAYGFRMAGVFQSTLPARGATDADVLFLCNVEFQSTLPARGATRVTKAECLDLPISIHAPRTGSDGIGDIIHARRKISIHAPRTGSDAPPTPTAARSGHFNPRSPHGERPPSAASNGHPPDFNPRSPHGERRPAPRSPCPSRGFQSTLPARGATCARWR